MNSASDDSAIPDEDIDLLQIAKDILKRKTLVASSLAVAIVIAIGYLHVATYTYTVTLSVSPVLSSSDAASSKLSGLSGLASLAGVSVPTDPGMQAFVLYQEGVYSRDVADRLAKNPQIMHTVFSDAWSAERDDWIKPTGIVSTVVGFVKFLVGIPQQRWQPPDGAQLQEYIAANVSVENNSRNPTVTISYRNENPQFGAMFLTELDRSVDGKLRDIALARSNQYIDYLSKQLRTVTNEDIRQSLLATLTDQQKIRMMASVTAPYAAQPFGKPSASRVPTRPNPFLVFAIAMFAGGSLGILGALWFPPLNFSAVRLRKTYGSKE